MTTHTYTVHTTLAGHSAARTWRGTYKTLAGAVRVANRLTGHGIIGTVRNDRTNELVYRGR